MATSGISTSSQFYTTEEVTLSTSTVLTLISSAPNLALPVSSTFPGCTSALLCQGSLFHETVCQPTFAGGFIGVFPSDP